MNLGIFGDSFGDSRINLDEDHSSINTNTKSWPYILAKKLNATNLYNFCENGSSLFYSYKKFLEYQHKCDLVIFLVTVPGRYTKLFRFKHINRSIHINSIPDIDQIIKNSTLTLEEHTQLEDLKKYYLMLDIEWETIACKCLLNEIKRVKNVLFVPCFSFFQENSKGLCLTDIREYQIKILKQTMGWKAFLNKYKETTNTVCHFTDEFNQYVAECMYHSLKDNIWNTTQVLPSTINHTFDHYYKLID